MSDSAADRGCQTKAESSDTAFSVDSGVPDPPFSRFLVRSEDMSLSFMPKAGGARLVGFEERVKHVNVSPTYGR